MSTRAVWVFNAGSSSLKYQLVQLDSGNALASGIAEQIGQPTGSITHTEGGETTRSQETIADHAHALTRIFELLGDLGDVDLVACGHRVVHGGDVFTGPVVITDDVVEQISAMSPLAPLHNPPNLVGIAAARQHFPQVPHVAVFDTAFFHGLPAAAHTYAIDREVARVNKIRRYGFHGTSHQYVSEQVATFLGEPITEINQIVAHLGNGASVSAISGGVPIDTSMGLTPLEGLVMGTRSGDIDPGIIAHLHRTAGMSLDDIDTLLNRRSGIFGLSGVTDFRELTSMLDVPEAALAYAVYIHRLRKYIGAYLVELGGAQAITFTAGVGENASLVRADALARMQWLGIEIDAERNAERSGHARRISTDGSSIAVLVVPTNEESAIAQQAAQAVGS